jgi:hypothetical protein
MQALAAVETNPSTHPVSYASLGHIWVPSERCHDGGKSRVIIRSQISTWFSQEALVGVKCKLNIGMGVQPRLYTKYFVNRQIIHNQMDLAALPAHHSLVQKPHEFGTGMSSGAATLDLAGVHLQSGKQRNGSVMNVLHTVPLGSTRPQGKSRFVCDPHARSSQRLASQHRPPWGTVPLSPTVE